MHVGSNIFDVVWKINYMLMATTNLNISSAKSAGAHVVAKIFTGIIGISLYVQISYV